MAKELNSIRPMSELEVDEIEELDETIAQKFKFDPDLGGKWMLFYDKNDIDDMWTQAVNLYRAGQLSGIVSIRTSTAAKCERAGETQNGVIRFTCGPWDDEDLILKYGLNLIKKMNYFSSYGFVAYKTDDQSRAGTTATGAVKNYKYRLPVSTRDHLKPRSSTSSDEYPIELPSRTTDRPRLIEAKHSVVAEGISEPLEYGKFAWWTMFFVKGTPHDSAWKTACRLYRSDELDGVLYLRTRTAKAEPGHEGQKKGVISFYCNPNECVPPLREIGAMLVRIFTDSVKFPTLKCKIYSHGGTATTVLCQVPF